jgi:hypothetical protein
MREACGFQAVGATEVLKRFKTYLRPLRTKQTADSTSTSSNEMDRQALMPDGMVKLNRYTY